MRFALIIASALLAASAAQGQSGPYPRDGLRVPELSSEPGSNMRQPGFSEDRERERRASSRTRVFDGEGGPAEIERPEVRRVGDPEPAADPRPAREPDRARDPR